MYKTKRGLKINKHQNGDKKVKCNICHNLFKSPITLKGHIHEKNSHKCALCGKEFNQSVYLKKHVKLIHENNHKCASYSKVFNQVGILKAHIHTIHEEGRKNYQIIIMKITNVNFVANHFLQQKT